MECPCGKVFMKNVSGSLVLKAVTLPLQGKKGVKRATIDERMLRDGLDNDTVNTPFVQFGRILFLKTYHISVIWYVFEINYILYSVIEWNVFLFVPRARTLFI